MFISLSSRDTNGNRGFGYSADHGMGKKKPSPVSQRGCLSYPHWSKEEQKFYFSIKIRSLGPHTAWATIWTVTSKNESLEIMTRLYKEWFKTCKTPLGLGEVSERDDRFHFCTTILCDTHLESQGISLPRLSALQGSVETVFHSSSF